MLVWGFFISTVAVYHGTYTINSLSHVFGRQRYKTGDASRNNIWLALITLGEGWHNNHHHYPASVRQGFYWWEFDITFYMLKLMSFLGVIWDLKPVAAAIREGAGKRLYAALRSPPPMPSPPRPGALEELKSAVGEAVWLDASADLSPYTIDFRRLYRGATPLVLMPRRWPKSRESSASAIATKSAVVPHGGNTSYCGGATPDESGSQIVLSLRRLNRVRQHRRRQ